MATGTVQKSQELREGTKSGLVVESSDETVIACPLPFGPDEPVHVRPEPEGLSAATAANASVTSDRDDILTRLLGRLPAFHDWLLGPPLSERERVNVQLVRARDDLHGAG